MNVTNRLSMPITVFALKTIFLQNKRKIHIVIDSFVILVSILKMGYPANELQILKRPMHMLLPLRGCKFAGPLRAFEQRPLTSVLWSHWKD